MDWMIQKHFIIALLLIWDQDQEEQVMDCSSFIATKITKKTNNYI